MFKPLDSSGVSLLKLENWRIRKFILVCNLKEHIKRFMFDLPVYGTFQTEITHHIGWPHTKSQIHVVGDERNKKRKRNFILTGLFGPEVLKNLNARF